MGSFCHPLPTGLSAGLSQISGLRRPLMLWRWKAGLLAVGLFVFVLFLGSFLDSSHSGFECPDLGAGPPPGDTVCV